MGEMSVAQSLVEAVMAFGLIGFIAWNVKLVVDGIKEEK